MTKYWKRTHFISMHSCFG